MYFITLIYIIGDDNKKIMFAKPAKKDTEDKGSLDFSSKKKELQKRIDSEKEKTKQVKNSCLLSFDEDEDFWRYLQICMKNCCFDNVAKVLREFRIFQRLKAVLINLQSNYKLDAALGILILTVLARTKV